MAEFKGWLVRFGSTQLPNSFLKRYISTPNQRIELSAQRDGNVYLHRETSPNYKSTVKLEVMPLSESQKVLFQGIVAGGTTNARERKVKLEYWNTETHTYETGEFYMPDIEYTISHIDDDGPRYDSFTVELIQY